MTRRTILLLACLTAGGLLSGAAPAWAGAQRADDDAGRPDSLRVYEVEGVVVERTRTSREASAVPFSDLDARAIERLSFGQDVPMVLSSLPSSYAYSDAGNGFGYSYIKIRGFDQNRIGMLLNGVPINDPEAHQVYWVDHGDVLSGAGSVEVQRGVGTTLFGATSFGGSVNVLTSPRSMTPGVHLQTEYGDFTDSDIHAPTRSYRAAFSTGPILEGKAALYARYSRSDVEGYRIQSGVDQESFALSALYSGARASHKLDLHVGRERTQFAWDGVSPDSLPDYLLADNPCQLIDLDDREARRCNPYSVYPDNVDDFDQVIASVTSELPVGKDMRLSNTVYYVDGAGFFEQFKASQDFFDYGLEPIVVNDTTTIEETDLVRRRWLDNHYWGVLPQLRLPVGDGRMTLGAGLRRYEARHFGDLVWTDVNVAAPPLDRYYRYATEKTSFELYGRVEYPILRRTILSAALQYQGHRYDWTQERIGNFRGWAFEANHDFLSPRLGIRQTLVDGGVDEVSAYASISHARREPAGDDYIDGDDPRSEPALVGADVRTTGLDDPILKPERVLDLELGAEWRRPRWTARLGLYQLEFQDELIPLDGGRIFEEGRLRRANADRTRHQGVELETSVRPRDAVEVTGNLSLARHRFIDHEIYAYWLDGYVGGRLSYDGNTIPRSPELMANVQIAYDREPARASVMMRHVGKQYIDGENTERLTIDPFTLVNATAALDIARALGSARSMELEIRVNNVFDTLYETFGYTFYDDFPPRQLSFYWPGATRSILVSVRTAL